jgi:hypothetical protein
MAVDAGDGLLPPHPARTAINVMPSTAGKHGMIFH